ncbi:MAG: hypothetical protein HUJ42_01730 [Malacoplasma sp.]|nr:hypothetical protein [Malacoplasma sp.]
MDYYEEMPFHSEKKKIINSYKEIAKLAFCGFLSAVFIVPLGYFAVLTITEYLKTYQQTTLVPLLIVSIVLFFDMLYYLYLEIKLFIKIWKQRFKVNKYIYYLAFINFVLTFISCLTIFILCARECIIILDLKMKQQMKSHFRKCTKRYSNRKYDEEDIEEIKKC